MVTNSLQPNEFCFYLGQSVPLLNPVVDVQPLASGNFKLSLTVEVTPQDVNTGSTSKPLGSGNFAVFALGDHRNGAVTLIYAAENGNDDVYLGLKFKTSGTKGNHGV